VSSRKVARSLVRAAFPGHDSLVDRLFRDHEGFRELCDDYRRCAVALDRWQRLNGDDPSARGREYAALLTELAVEIETWLEAIQNEDLRPKGGGQ